VCNTGENDCPQNDTIEAVDTCDENIKLPVSVSNDDSLHVQQSVDTFYVGIFLFSSMYSLILHFFQLGWAVGTVINLKQFEAFFIQSNFILQ